MQSDLQQVNQHEKASRRLSDENVKSKHASGFWVSPTKGVRAAVNAHCLMDFQTRDSSARPPDTDSPDTVNDQPGAPVEHELPLRSSGTSQVSGNGKKKEGIQVYR